MKVEATAPFTLDPLFERDRDMLIRRHFGLKMVLRLKWNIPETPDATDLASCSKQLNSTRLYA